MFPVCCAQRERERERELLKPLVEDEALPLPSWKGDVISGKADLQAGRQAAAAAQRFEHTNTIPF